MPDNANSDRFHSRKNPRLKNYDYAKPNYYFITICTREKKCLFGEAGNLNAHGKIAEKGLLEIDKHFQDVTVDKFVVMPNHIHAIIILTGQAANLSVVLGQYKAFVSNQIHRTDPQETVWQASFHDHVIRDQQSYEKIWLYIDTNPANWKKDCFFTK